MEAKLAEYSLIAGDTEAVVTARGAALRVFRVAGRDVVTPFAAETIPTGSKGQVLLPWPNRIRDGKWRLDGTLMQLPVNEPARNNAIHGLVRDLTWQVVAQEESAITLQVDVAPQPGWPGSITARHSYEVADGILRVGVRIDNISGVRLPVGYGAHPYIDAGFFAGADSIADLNLEHTFAKALVTDERLLPVELADAPAIGRIRDTELDSAWTSPQNGWRVLLSNDAAQVEITASGCEWVQVYTPPERDSIAIEPMTCGPNAFNDEITANGLAWLEPGDHLGATWWVSTSARTP